MGWLRDIAVIFPFTKFLANVIHLPVQLYLDTCNDSAPDNPVVSFPEPGDAAGGGNGPVMMMNSILLLTTVVMPGAQPAATKGLPQENKNCCSRPAQALLPASLVEGCEFTLWL